jgi:uncharacterized protein YprB with RNaseH-like and TPR domain
VGIRSTSDGLVQLVGEQITADAIRAVVPCNAVLYTYNGHCFDLPVIRNQLDLDLLNRCDSRDLRWICQRHGLRGGQKAIETAIGVARALAGMDGRDALVLWDRFRRRGDAPALETLLRYNAEDLDGLVAIRDHLHRRKLLTV